MLAMILSVWAASVDRHGSNATVSTAGGESRDAFESGQRINAKSPTDPKDGGAEVGFVHHDLASGRLAPLSLIVTNLENYMRASG